MLHLRRCSPRFSGGGARGGLTRCSTFAGARNCVIGDMRGVVRALTSRRLGPWRLLLGGAVGSGLPGHLGLEWIVLTCHSFTAALELFMIFHLSFLPTFEADRLTAFVCSKNHESRETSEAVVLLEIYQSILN